jgi:hypothetical protein
MLLSATGKSRVFGLAGLFAIDSLGGGFLTDALVAYWCFRRFGVSEVQLGALFFVIHLLNAASHLGAAWLAKRFGLLKTMVFTHLPSSVFLISVPLAPSFPFAAALLLARESLVEMDVPTRQSYVAAVVQPREPIFAARVTNLSRNIFWAMASGLSGVLMQSLTFSAPLIVGGALKVGYDVLLYRKFGRSNRQRNCLSLRVQACQIPNMRWQVNPTNERKLICSYIVVARRTGD